MDIRLLIDQIVRQTTVLIAQLSTAAGVRAPLSTIADQVFLELTSEIERQGVGKKVVADMFGMSLRKTYQRRVQRVAESVTVRDKTLWEAVLEYLDKEGSRTREEVIERFQYDGEENVAAVLNDLAMNGVVYRAGRGGRMVYGITSDTDFDRLVAKDEFTSLQELVRVQLYRMGKSTAEEIASVLRIDVERVSEALNALKKQQEIRIDEKGFARCDVCMIPVGAQVGWEAAVFDHFQALTKAVAHKLETLGAQSKTQDPIGGATLSFDIHKGHPEAENVFGLLEKVRAAVNEVWERVTELEKSQPVAEDDKIKVTFYFGQNVEYLGLGEITDRESAADESQEST